MCSVRRCFRIRHRVIGAMVLALTLWSCGSTLAAGQLMPDRPNRPARPIPLQFQSLFITLTGTGSGSVVSSPDGINCPGQCSANFVTAVSVTLTAIAPSGSTFTGWSGACSGTGNCTIALTGSQIVYADFGLAASKSVASPVLAVSPSPFDFGTVQVGTASSKTVQLFNTGQTAAGNLVVSGMSVDNPLFNISGNQFPISVAPGTSVPLTLAFTPQSNSTASAKLSFNSNASNPAATISLTGTGGTTTSTGALNITPAYLFFGNVNVGAIQIQSLLMSNTGSGTTMVFAGTVGGNGFSIISPAFPLVLPPGTAQLVTITFAPIQPGSALGLITFTTNVAGAPGVSLIASGNATTPATAASVFPTAVDFGPVPISSTYLATVVLYNTGNTTLNVNGAVVSGSGFGIDPTAYPVSIPVNGSQAFTFSFTPPAAGSLSGTITFSTDAAINPVVGVTGTGAFASAHTATLSWSSGPSPVLGFNVYRSNTSGSGYRRLTFTKQLTFADASVSGATTYYYVVTAVGTNGPESVYSNQAVAAIP